MQAGDFDCRVTFQRQQVLDGEYGPQPTNTWEDVYTRVPAQVRDLLPSKAETVEGGLRMVDRPARLRMRYITGITSDMRVIVHRRADEVFQLSTQPAEIGRQKDIEILIKAYSA